MEVPGQKQLEGGGGRQSPPPPACLELMGLFTLFLMVNRGFSFTVTLRQTPNRVTRMLG